MALARTGRAQKQGVLALGDEARGRELEDERAVGVTESGLLVPPGEQPVLAPLEFVVDERRDEVDGGHLLGLGLLQARVEHVGHAGEAELALGLIRFGGHLPRGEYDVDHDGHAGQADAAELHG